MSNKINEAILRWWNSVTKVWMKDLGGHPGDDLIELMHGHHCCKGDCWHAEAKRATSDCTCYGLGSSHADDCPAWESGEAEEERKKYG